MGRKPRVDRSREEEWQIVQEGIKSGNVSETCRRHGIAANLFYRWKDEAEQGAKAALGGEKRCRGGNREGPSHPAVGTDARTEVAGDRNPKKRRGGSELWCSSLPGTGNGERRLHGHAGGGDPGHQSVESVLPEET